MKFNTFIVNLLFVQMSSAGRRPVLAIAADQRTSKRWWLLMMTAGGNRIT
jgi:hypothetical protein